MLKKDEIIEVAKQIRNFLQEEFPENPNLEKQCKRASILLDIYFQKKKIKAYPTTGFITKKGDKNDYNRGHVWNIIKLDNVPYLLDITLSQFEDYLQFEIPKIIFLPYQEAKEIYSYKPDGKGKYTYRKDDVRLSLVTKVNNLV